MEFRKGTGLGESLLFSMATLGRRMPLARPLATRCLWIAVIITLATTTAPYAIWWSVELSRNLQVFMGEGYFGYHYNTGVDHGGAFNGGFSMELRVFPGAGWLPRREGIYNHRMIQVDTLYIPLWFLWPLPIMLALWIRLRHQLARRPICVRCGYLCEGRVPCPECGDS